MCVAGKNIENLLQMLNVYGEMALLLSIKYQKNLFYLSSGSWLSTIHGSSSNSSLDLLFRGDLNWYLVFVWAAFEDGLQTDCFILSSNFSAFRLA